MKKLVTLILVLAGIVGTASADEYTTFQIGGQKSLTGSGSDWSVISLSDNGSGVYTYTAIQVLTAGTDYEYKYILNGNWDTANSSNRTFRVESGGRYEITFSVNKATADGGNPVDACSTSAVRVARVDDLYLGWGTGGGGGKDPTTGIKMTNDNGIYTATQRIESGQYVLIIPGSAWSGSGITDWPNIIGAVADNDYGVFIEHMEGSTKSPGSYKRWKIEETATYTFTYNSITEAFTINAQITAPVSAAGWATFSLGSSENSHGYTIDGAEAYYVSSTDGTTANLTPIASDAKIPTYPDGILLKKIGGGEVTITTTSTSDAALTGNMLQGSGRYTDWNINNYDYTGYYLANGSHGVGFYAAETGNMLPYRAFLKVSSGSPAREFFSLDGETTGIDAAKASQKMNGEFFNLAGQRVAQPTKGLYIVNGKKVIMK